ncbi:unnamed protein product [Parajaminaea phylloscopi]
MPASFTHPHTTPAKDSTQHYPGVAHHTHSLPGAAYIYGHYSRPETASHSSPLYLAHAKLDHLDPSLASPHRPQAPRASQGTHRLHEHDRYSDGTASARRSLSRGVPLAMWPPARFATPFEPPPVAPRPTQARAHDAMGYWSSAALVPPNIHSMETSHRSEFHAPSNQTMEGHRKRLRNSRSCAECQRRKTRCDVVGAFVSESDHLKAGPGPSANSGEDDMVIIQPCTNCIRGNLECQYSRRPLRKEPPRADSKHPEVEAKRALSDDVTTTSQGAPVTGSPGQKKDDSDVAGLVSRPYRPWEESYPSASRSRQQRGRVLSDGTQRDSSAQSRALSTHRMQREEEHRRSASLTPSPQQARFFGRARSDTILRCAAIEGDLQESFAKCSANVTFGLGHMCSEVADASSTVDRTLLRRAMALATERIHADGSGSPSRERRDSHVLRLASLRGEALTGRGESTALSKIETSSEGLAAIRAARSISSATAGVESDALLLCYLDGVRFGKPDAASLAVAVSRFSSTLDGHCWADDTVARASALYSVDRWHAFAFGSPFVLPESQVSEHVMTAHLRTLLAGTKEKHGPGCQGVMSLEVLRAALIFSALIGTAHRANGWRHVSPAECEAVFNYYGDRTLTHAYEHEHHAASSLERAKSVTLGERDVRDDNTVDDDPGQAFGRSLRSCIRLYCRVQTTHWDHTLTVKVAAGLVEALELCLLPDATDDPARRGTLLLQSFVGPHVFSVVAASLMLIDRTIAYLLQGLRSTHEGDMPTQKPTNPDVLEDLHRRAQHCATVLNIRCLTAAEVVENTGLRRTGLAQGFDASDVGPLYLRIAVFNETTVRTLAALNDIRRTDRLQHTQSESHPAKNTSSLERRKGALLEELSGMAELIGDSGPLGLVLASTTDAEAWILAQGGKVSAVFGRESADLAERPRGHGRHFTL